MATAVVSSGSCSNLNCLLCFNQFINPRVLPCLHSFCEKCLGDYIVSNVKKSSEKILCPVCKEKCDPPNRKIPIDKWASSFVLNGIIVSILELLENTDESSRLCDPCKSEGEEVNAEFWCPDCGDKLCATCLRHHRRNRASKNHKTFPIEEMKTGENLKLKYDPHCICDRGDSVNILCVNHKQKICTICATTTHRNCKELVDLAKTGTELTQGNMAANVLKDVEKMKKNFEQYNNIRKTTILTFKSDIDKCVHEMDDLCSVMIQQIEQFQIKFRTTAQRLRENMESNHQKNEKNLHKFSTNFDNSNQIFKAFNHHGDPKQKYIAYDTVITQLNSHYARLTTELEGEEDVRVSLDVNKICQEFKKMATALGKINTSSTPSVSASNFVENMNGILKTMTTRTRVNPSICSAQIPKNIDPLKCSMTLVTSVTRREVTGGRADFIGGTSLTNGHLIMADHYINHNRLVEFDTRHKMAAEYKLDGTPIDVTSHGDIVYVSVLRDGVEWYIYKCRVDGGLSVMERIKAPGRTWGLAVCDDGRMVVGTDTAVHVLSQSGKPVHKITRSGLCSYVAVSRNTDMFYSNGDAIVCRGLQDYTEKYRYRHDDMKRPTGMCVGDRDVLYVCCRGSGNVHQISPDGQRGRVVLDRLHGITHPYGVLYNPHTKQYIVTSGVDDTVMEVYTQK